MRPPKLVTRNTFHLVILVTRPIPHILISLDRRLNSPRKEQDTVSQTTATQPAVDQASDKAAVRPFQVNVPETELTELRRRINAAKFPERETVTDATQGVQLATVQALARYWATGYDWRKIEAELNALPQFLTEIHGLDIHFIHVRSKHEKALPLIVTHGWPGSITEQMKIIDPLTNPTAHGGNASDAFDVVVPSMPGYGFSGRPTATGWDPAHIARAWTVLMKRLGYTKFVAQGGDSPDRTSACTGPVRSRNRPLHGPEDRAPVCWYGWSAPGSPGPS
jgi:hypothetical protein